MDWREAAEARIARAAAGGGEDEDARADEAGSHSPTRSSSISPLASAEHGPGPTMEEIEREFDELTRKLEDEARLIESSMKERRRRDANLEGVVARTRKGPSDCFLTTVRDDTAEEEKEQYPNYRKELSLAAAEQVVKRPCGKVRSAS
jgi:hypothetical protein